MKIKFICSCYQDGEPINKTDNKYEFKKVGRKHSLVIKDATVHLEGEYSAVVGEAETSCELTGVFSRNFIPQLEKLKILITPLTNFDEMFLAK